ncbi:MAG: hypothetical protein HFI24_10535, partial [Lachnospiraceae bacterium]|nr:hypothetical protein [Lachnospiraceae bacterium]
MCRYKMIMIWTCSFLMALNIAACGQAKEDDTVDMEEVAANQQEDSAQAAESANSETEEEEAVNEGNSVINQQESSGQEDGDTDLEATADELLDSFINGSINAVDSADLTSGFSITDLNMDSGEWDSYSIGEKVDLDNDGENELIINGPYGGIYLDA